MTKAILCLFATFLAIEAQAGFYAGDARYRCENTGRRAAKGAIAGGILGFVGDQLLNGRTTALTPVMAIAGAGIGAASSCEQVGGFYEEADEYLEFNQERRWNHRAACEMVFVGDGWASNGAYCKTFECVNRRGRIVKTETSCKLRRGWHHGYSADRVYSRRKHWRGQDHRVRSERYREAYEPRERRHEYRQRDHGFHEGHGHRGYR